ncbi:MAG: ABC transporter substrate-binding protein [Nitriliruptor sp.]
MRSAKRALALAAATALVLTACGGGDTDDGDTTDPEVTEDGAEDGAEDGSEDAEAASGGEFSIRGCEPQFLNTTDTRDVCGGAVLRLLFAPLVETDPETGEPSMGTAESIESEDNQTWTITLREGDTFHDGTPVTAQSYADAWNAVAGPEAGNSFFFSRFEGFEELQAGEAEELSGVEVVDDQTLEVTLTEPFGPFLISLNDTSFYPLPEAYFDDPDAFQDAPIGNGRYQMDGEWERNQQIALTKFEDYSGEDPGLADAITFVIYDDINTAYLDVQAGSLDVSDVIPPEQEGAVDGEFGENVLRTPTSSFTYLGFPMFDERFGDNPELRQALSLAVDREAIISAIFSDTLRPATAIIPPVLEAYREDACEFCEFDPERAQELFEEAGGYDGTMTMYFNSGAGHEEWVEAVANQWNEVLGIEDVQFESLEFAQYLDLLDAEEIEGPFRLGWILSYLSPQYALEDLYTTDAGSNSFGYSNPEFDEALADANATDPEEADSAYQEAEDILLADLPLIPMWYGQSTSVWGDRVEGVIMDPSGYVRAERISVVED